MAKDFFTFFFWLLGVWLQVPSSVGFPSAILIATAGCCLPTAGIWHQKEPWWQMYSLLSSHRVIPLFSWKKKKVLGVKIKEGMGFEEQSSYQLLSNDSPFFRIILMEKDQLYLILLLINNHVAFHLENVNMGRMPFLLCSLVPETSL